MNLETLQQFWSQREPRERLALACGVLLAAVALLYLLIEPAASTIAQLRRSLPSARAQSAQLQALLAEVRALKSRPAVASSASADTPAAIEQSLKTAGLKAVRVVPLANGALQLTFANVPYAAWSVWLASTEREFGMRATNVTAKATATPGNADVDVALRSGHE